MILRNRKYLYYTRMAISKDSRFILISFTKKNKYYLLLKLLWLEANCQFSNKMSNFTKALNFLLYFRI